VAGPAAGRRPIFTFGGQEDKVGAAATPHCLLIVYQVYPCTLAAPHPWPGLSFPDCSLVVCRYTRTLSPHPPPWPYTASAFLFNDILRRGSALRTRPCSPGKAVRYAHMATAAVLPNGTMLAAWRGPPHAARHVMHRIAC